MYSFDEINRIWNEAIGYNQWNGMHYWKVKQYFQILKIKSSGQQMLLALA